MANRTAHRWPLTRNGCRAPDGHVCVVLSSVLHASLCVYVCVVITQRTRPTTRIAAGWNQFSVRGFSFSSSSPLVGIVAAAAWNNSFDFERLDNDHTLFRLRNFSSSQTAWPKAPSSPFFFFRYFLLEGIVDLSAAERKPQPKDVNSIFLSIEMDITTQFDRIHTIFFICFAYHVLLHFGRRFGRCDVITVRSATRNSGGRTSREPTRLTTRVRT